LNHNTVRSACRRLARRYAIVRNEEGYELPLDAFESELERQFHYNGQKDSLPRFHDIHLIFKPENIEKAMSKQGRSLRTIPCLSDGGRVISKRWKASKRWRTPNARWKPLKGGLQGRFDFDTHIVTVQVYTNGTVKVIMSNSEHPFDVIGLRECLAAVDGLFLSRTGFRFLGVSGISDFFYFEKVHFSTDILGDSELSGASRCNCTVRQFDGWLYRIYEKHLGDKLFLRSEKCLEKGNFEDHDFNSMLALMECVITPSVIAARLFKETRDHAELEKIVRRQQNEIYNVLRSYTRIVQRMSHELRHMSSSTDAIREKLSCLGSQVICAPGGMQT